MGYDQIIQAIKNLFNDTSRPQSETVSDLRGIRDEVEMLLETMDE